MASEIGPERRRYCLVHNAASMAKDSALMLSSEALRNCLELNTVVPAEINRLFYPQMLPGSSVV
eukprot:COSAG02_NODE_6801_length_3352_cov_170.007378_2_plen_64_part_00